MIEELNARMVIRNIRNKYNRYRNEDGKEEFANGLKCAMDLIEEMQMTPIDKTIRMLENEKACVERANSCDRACEKCELVKDTTKIISAYNEAIYALKHYARIREVIGRWNCDYHAEKSRSDYFLEIIQTFEDEE